MKPQTLLSLTKFILFVIGYFFLPVFCGAVTITSTSGGGNWSSPATWQGGVVPDNSDTVIIQTGTVVMDVSDTIAVLIMQSGQLNLGQKLFVSGSFIFNSGGMFGVDTIIIGGYANFLTSGVKKIGNQIVLTNGGFWDQGNLDFTLHPTLGGSNVAPSNAGGSIHIKNDTLKIHHSANLSFKTNTPDGFIGSPTSVLQNKSQYALTNTGIGVGIGGPSGFVLYRHHLEGGGGGGGLHEHCTNGVRDMGETGIDCGGLCGPCPQSEPDEGDGDDDPDTDGIQGGGDSENPGGNSDGVGTTCNTNETAGAVPIIDTIHFSIIVGEANKMVFNSHIYFSPTASVQGFGTLKINNSVLDLNNGMDSSKFLVRKLILNDGSVIRGNGTIASRTVHSIKSTLRGSINYKVTRFALDNSILTGVGTAVVDSQFILKGTIGNTINRTIDVKWNSKWQCPDISFAIDGKINIDANATMHVKMLSSEIRFRNGKGPVVDNRGLVNFIGTSTGKLVTPTNGSYFWNNGPQAVGRVKVIDASGENAGGGPGGSGGGDPADGEGDIEPGNGGDAGCDNTPVDPPVQEGCFKLAKGVIRTRKGVAKYNTCFQDVATGGLTVSGTGNLIVESGSSGSGLNVNLEQNDGATLTMNTCLGLHFVNMLGNNTTLNLNADCSATNLTVNAGKVGGNGNLTINGNLILNGGIIEGSRNITVHGTSTFTTGTLRNKGKTLHNGIVYWNGGTLGSTVGIMDTLITNDSLIINTSGGKFLTNRYLEINNHARWSQGNVNLELNSSIKNSLYSTFSIAPSLETDRGFVTSFTATPGKLMNYGTITKTFSGNTILTCGLDNFGSLNHNAGNLSLAGNTNHYTGSTINASVNTRLYFSAFDFNNKTHTFHSGSTLNVSSNIETNLNAIATFLNGVNFSGNPGLKNNVGSIWQSKIPQTFSNIENLAEIRDSFSILCLGDLRFKSGFINNHGNVNINGKLNWETGRFGNGIITGNVEVSDSAFITGSLNHVNKKHLKLHGNTILSSTDFQLLNGATLTTDSTMAIDVAGSIINIGGDNSTSFFNKAHLKKKTGLLSSLNIGPNFINRGIIAGNGTFTFNQFTNRCIVAPGLSPGLIKFNKFSNDSSFLHMELGYDQNMAFAKDSFVVTALPASLGGELDLMLTGGFIPDSGAVYRMITLPSGYTGTFNEVQTMGMPNDSFNWITIYNPTNVEIKYCPVWYKDEDGDGHGDFDNPEKYTACTAQPMGFVRSYDDCDDGDNLEFPGQVWYFDNDGDGYGGDDDGSCTRFVGGVHSTELIGVGDCDDGNASVYPGAPEICDGVDNNCNNLLENDDTSQTHLIVVSTGNGPGSLPYLFNNCPIVDTIFFDSVIEGDTIHYGANGLLFTNSIFLVNPEANPVTIAFDQSVVDDPIVLQGSSTEVLFKGLNFIFSNNAGKCGITTTFLNNKVFLDDVEIQTEDVFELCGPGEIEVRNGVKIRY